MKFKICLLVLLVSMGSLSFGMDERKVGEFFHINKVQWEVIEKNDITSSNVRTITTTFERPIIKNFLYQQKVQNSSSSLKSGGDLVKVHDPTYRVTPLCIGTIVAGGSLALYGLYAYFLKKP